MARKPDWLDFAHQLDKEREAMQDALPDGIECTLSLSSHGYGDRRFTVFLNHRASDLGGYGAGSTPAKALAAAKEDMAKNVREKKRPVQIAGAKTLPAAPKPQSLPGMGDDG